MPVLHCVLEFLRRHCQGCYTRGGGRHVLSPASGWPELGQRTKDEYVLACHQPYTRRLVYIPVSFAVV